MSDTRASIVNDLTAIDQMLAAAIGHCTSARDEAKSMPTTRSRLNELGRDLERCKRGLVWLMIDMDSTRPGAHVQQKTPDQIAASDELFPGQPDDDEET